MIIKKIYSGLYRAKFVFIISSSKKKVEKRFNLIYNGYGGCAKYHKKIYILVSPKAHSEDIVHECDHAVGKLWKTRGIKKIKGADECYSYMLSWIYDKCHKIWKKKHKK